MKRTLLIILLALGLASVTNSVSGQSTNHHAKASTESKPSGDHKETAGKKGSGPFHGNLLAVDKIAKTVSVGKRVFQITSETKIKKAGKPATLDDAVVGEEVGGYYKAGTDGKLNAVSLRIGPKPAATTTPDTEKKKVSDKGSSSAKQKPPQ